MANIGLYVFGTSVLWGQGHKRPSKMHTRLAKWLRSRHGGTVRVHYAPHSGAVVLGNSTAKRLHGEVPVPFPSIARQIRLAPPAAEAKVYVLVDGGINDVGVINIINPTFPRARLKRKTAEACHRRMTKVLTQIGRKYRGSDILVLGYYQILADRIRRHARSLAALLDVLNICDPEDLKGIDFVPRAVDNCKLFWQESDRQLRRAVRDVAPNIAGTVSFVSSAYTPANGVFGRDPLLFNLGDRDPQLKNRMLPCTKAILKGRTKAHCYMASIGHPNRKGVTRYLNRLKQAMP